MADINRADYEHSNIELTLTEEEAIALHTVLRHVSGAGKTRNKINGIVDILDRGGIPYDPNVMTVDGDDDLRFRD